MIRLIIAFLAVFLSTFAFAHEVQMVTQHLKLNRQNASAWQSDLLARATFTPKFEAGLQGTYLERFDLYEKRAGGFFVFKPTPTLTLEAKYLKGDGVVEILPKDQYLITLYHSLAQGYSPFVTYQNSLYSITHLQSMKLGMEIEKFEHFIVIPQVMLGQAQFRDPGDVKEINSLGVRVIYYEEQKYSVTGFAYQGLEASQGIVGRSTSTIATKSIGGGGAYYFIPNVKTELLFEYLDLGKLNNQFLTTTLNLAWVF